eukprot:278858-Prorocentrum_minimum.AAC.1
MNPRCCESAKPVRWLVKGLTDTSAGGAPRRAGREGAACRPHPFRGVDGRPHPQHQRGGR